MSNISPAMSCDATEANPVKQKPGSDSIVVVDRSHPSARRADNSSTPISVNPPSLASQNSTGSAPQLPQQQFQAQPQSVFQRNQIRIKRESIDRDEKRQQVLHHQALQQNQAVDQNQSNRQTNRYQHFTKGSSLRAQVTSNSIGCPASINTNGGSGAGGGGGSSTVDKNVARAFDKAPDDPAATRTKRPALISKELEISAKRRRLIDIKTASLLSNREKYYEQLSELFFLQNGGHFMDLFNWRRKPPPGLLQYMHTKQLGESSDYLDRVYGPKDRNTNTPPTAVTPTSVLFSSSASSAAAATVASQLSSPSSTALVPPLAPPPVPHQAPTPVATTPAASSATLSTSSQVTSTPPGATVASATASADAGNGRTSPTTLSRSDELAERAKQEAHVLQRVGALRKAGMWTQQRLPKVQEPHRVKTHWDYLLEEMKWMSNDFAQERKSKKAAARKCAKMCQKYHQEKEVRAQRAERDEHLRIRKLAATIAKDVKAFWSNAEKLLDFRIQSKLDAKRKEALDLQLNLLVDRTEKFSHQIRDKLAGGDTPSVTDTMSDVQDMDNDFVEYTSEEDDEETIAKEEKLDRKTDHERELNELEEDNGLSVEELMAKYYSAPQNPKLKSGTSSGQDSNEEGMDVDGDDDVDDEEDEDDDDDEALSNGEEDAQDDKKKLKSLVVEEDDDATQEASNNMDDDDATQENTPPNNHGDDDLNGITAVAERFQPKGLDLATAQVITPVPFLLKHTLREYQHVGLDWLVAMCEQKLNGILADEMGLGKTIQTIALLAHLAVEKRVWGPHLVVVPTSVMLNWEMEFKKWCPGFKILTYYGSMKERKQKRIGWTKKNAFHVCITSYKLVVQDHSAFRRKQWYYLILDEAQNIKNFKSQRWQLLLNFQAERRLLLTGTPLQNTLMELWSLMHFLMPHLFESHKEFREWFSNPLTGMVEGSSEYNEALVKRLHRVLRPFLLRRLKSEVERQMPQKYEHILMCRLSKRQRFLYDDFMSQAKTKETLASGKLLSVLNVLMQLRKVCNHPALFEPNPVSSPFRMEAFVYHVPSLVLHMENPLKSLFCSYNLHLADLELVLTAFAAHRIKKFQTSPEFIEIAESHPQPPPRCPSGKIRLHIRTTGPSATQQVPRQATLGQAAPGRGVVSGHLRGATPQGPTQRLVMLGQRPEGAVGSPPQQVTFQLVQKTAQAGQASGQPQPPVTVHVQQTGASRTIGALHRIVQTTSGQHVLLTTAAPQPTNQAGNPQQVTTPIRPGLVRLPVQNQGQLNPQRPQSLLSPHRPVVTTVGSSVGVIPQTVQTRPPSTPVTAGTPPRSITTMSSFSSGSPRPPGASALSAPQARRPPAAQETSNPMFFDENLDKKRRLAYRNKLKLLGRVNNMRCASGPVYGQDLIEAVSVMNLEDRVPPPPPKRVAPLQTPYPDEVPADAIHRSAYGTGVGHLYTQNIHSHTSWWSDTNALRSLVPSPESLWSEYELEWKEFLCIHPRVSAPRISMHASHPPPHVLNQWHSLEARLNAELKPKFDLLSKIDLQLTTQFPDRRLIQFDCGKLQTLDKLLVQLKSGQHRVLIFTQMARMLDVLEEFLTMHGHTYLRLDGATGIEQRQVLVERFNSDKRVFCFILSTRSGGVGLNLTGADTVVFYDSDWNPTMDAQAQDRCHRIGQTRDVHIYRLVSERTIEENILRKANQKRMLGELAIEEGNFTTSFFRSKTITDIFEEQPAVKMEAESADAMSAAEIKREQEDFERTLVQVEEESDVTAARMARAEVSADLAEFDENIPYQDNKGSLLEETEEERKLMSQLNHIEKYALRFLETQHDFVDLKQAQEEVEAQKREWMIKSLQHQKEREEALREPPPVLSYKRPHSPEEKFVSLRDCKTPLPLWAPPTPPAGDDDVYVDETTRYLYASKPMEETALPPVYVRKSSSKRMRTDANHALLRKMKAVRSEGHGGPKSLFDRPSPVLVKMRKEARLLKLKRQGHGGSLLGQRPAPGTPSVPSTGPSAPQLPGQVGAVPRKQQQQQQLHEQQATPEPNQVEWTVNEDYGLLQVFQQFQELPMSLTVLMPGHTPNQDLLADYINSTVSRVYRSPKMCRNRFENVLAPREEGRPNAPIVAYDKKSVKKALKQKSGGRPIKTALLFAADNNASFTNLYTSRFDAIRTVSVHRTPAMKPVFTNTAQSNGQNVKHAAVLAEHGVNYDNPLNPIVLAKQREERLKKEKSRLAAAQAAGSATATTASTATSTTASQSTITSTASTPTASSAATAASGLSRGTIPQSGSAAAPSPSTPSTSTLAANPSTPTTTSTPSTAAGSVTTPAPSVMAVVGGGHIVTTEAQKIISSSQPQPIAASSNPIRTTQLVATTPVVSVTSLSPAQIQAAQRGMAGRSVTPSQQLQFQTLKHSTLIRQQGGQPVRSGPEQTQLKRIQQVVTSQAVKVTSQGSAGGRLVTTQAGTKIGQVVNQAVKTGATTRAVVNEADLTQLLKGSQAGGQKMLATGATLVKPSAVSLPASAVTVTGITLPVAAATAAQGAKGTPSAGATVQHQRILLQPLKKQPQQSVKTSPAGALQTTTVQIVHQQPGSSAGQTQNAPIKPVAVSQIIKHVLPGPQSANFVLATTTSAGSTPGTINTPNAQTQNQLLTALQQGVKPSIATVTLAPASSSLGGTRFLTVQQQSKAMLAKQHGETAVLQIPVSCGPNVPPSIQAVQAALQAARVQQAASGKAPQNLPYTMRIRHTSPAPQGQQQQGQQTVQQQQHAPKPQQLQLQSQQLQQQQLHLQTQQQLTQQQIQPQNQQQQLQLQQHTTATTTSVAATTTTTTSQNTTQQPIKTQINIPQTALQTQLQTQSQLQQQLQQQTLQQALQQQPAQQLQQQQVTQQIQQQSQTNLIQQQQQPSQATNQQHTIQQSQQQQTQPTQQLQQLIVHQQTITTSASGQNSTLIPATIATTIRPTQIQTSQLTPVAVVQSQLQAPQSQASQQQAALQQATAQTTTTPTSQVQNVPSQASQVTNPNKQNAQQQ